MEQIQEKVSQSPDSLVFPICYENQEYWVKKRPYAKHSIWHNIQKILSYLIPFDLLKPTVSFGGKDSLKAESDKLIQAKTLGLMVPDVKLITDEYLVTVSCGQVLTTLLSQENINSNLNLIHQAFLTLSQFHDKDMTHGRPMIKDMLFDGNNIFLIDFEEFPEQVMSIDKAKARDILLFLMSVGMYIDSTFYPQLESYAKKHPDVMLILSQWMGYLRIISGAGKRIVILNRGKDVVKFMVVIDFLSNYFKTYQVKDGSNG